MRGRLGKLTFPKCPFIRKDLDQANSCLRLDLLQKWRCWSRCRHLADQNKNWHLVSFRWSQPQVNKKAFDPLEVLKAWDLNLPVRCRSWVWGAGLSPTWARCWVRVAASRDRRSPTPAMPSSFTATPRTTTPTWSSSSTRRTRREPTPSCPSTLRSVYYLVWPCLALVSASFVLEDRISCLVNSSVRILWFLVKRQTSCNWHACNCTWELTMWKCWVASSFSGLP